HRRWSRRSESSERYDERRRVAVTIPGYGRRPRKIGAVLLAALVAATWTHPLAFRPLPGWQSGASGITRSRYTGPRYDWARQSSAWIARGVRYRDAATAHPAEPDARAPAGGRRRRLGGRLRPGRHGAATDPPRPPHRDALRLLRGDAGPRRRVRAHRRGPGGRRVHGDRPRLLRLAADA